MCDRCARQSEAARLEYFQVRLKDSTLRLSRDPSFGVGEALAGPLCREAACPAEEPPAPPRVRPSTV